MLETTTPEIIANRYLILRQIGQGGMGGVYQAKDRLTGQLVALKRVTVPAGLLQFMTRASLGDTTGLQIAIAQEFQVLASLRHPHIISVLDYGFDEERQPYFTMELLEGAQTSEDFVVNLSLEAKVQVLIEILQALAYLHRRGVIHRDLKPENILVVNGSIKVLDFGLAVERNYRSEELIGTLLYVAPEVLGGGVVTEASDLYAIGVMGCEFLTGQYPLNLDGLDFNGIANAIVKQPPDFSDSLLPAPFITLLKRLLSKSPAYRYSDANQVIVDLCAAVGQPPPVESTAIRESFVQAAAFVGREAELGQLSSGLHQATLRRGSIWLIGGESGIGKSRLLEEFRVRALVNGALVVRGQAVSEGGAAFQLWRTVVGHLILNANLDDDEVAALRPVFPEIGSVLERQVTHLGEIQGKDERVQDAVLSLFRKQPQLTVLMLEDLHWAGGDLDVLKRLAHMVEKLSLLIVATYRDDERPDLPDDLPSAHVLRLQRLAEDNVASLVNSMIGEAGLKPQVLHFLQQQTEGNAFFLVEIVRALAEESGSLAEIGSHDLPESVFTGGLESITTRRLARVSESARELLRLSAALGRVIDPPALKLISPQADIERWLIECSNAAILDVADNQWRFAHDKLREGILKKLGDEEKPALYRRTAAALEQLYRDDLAKASQIAFHWREAGDLNKEHPYSILARDYFLRVNLFRDAQRFAERAHLLSRFLYLDTLVGLARSHWLLSAYDEARTLLEEGIPLAQQLNRKDLLIDLMLIMGKLLKRQDMPEEGQRYLSEAIALATEMADRPRIAEGLLGLINPVANWDLHEARNIAQTALTIYRELDDEVGEGFAIVRLAATLLQPSEVRERKHLLERARDIFSKHHIRSSYAETLMNLVNLEMREDNYSTARALAEEGVQVARESGSKSRTAYMLIYLAQCVFELNEWDQAEAYQREALAIFQALKENVGVAYTLSGLGHFLFRMFKLKEAKTVLESCIELSERYQLGEFLMSGLTHLSMVLTELKDFQQASACLARAMTTALQEGLVSEKIYIISGVIYAAIGAGRYEEALEHVAFLENFPDTPKSILENVHRWQKTALARLSPDVVKAAAERGSSWSLEEVTARIAQ